MPSGGFETAILAIKRLQTDVLYRTATGRGGSGSLVPVGATFSAHVHTDPGTYTKDRGLLSRG